MSLPGGADACSVIKGCCSSCSAVGRSYGFFLMHLLMKSLKAGDHSGPCN